MAVVPDFLVIGVAKSATTALCDTLRGHPDVFVSTPKEPRYWCREDHELYKTPEWYATLFADAPPGSLRGEGSTRSTNPDHSARAARRMAAAIPDARLICLVRHPIARLESDWKMRVREGWADHDINKAVRAGGLLVEHSLYHEVLSPYREHFPPEQLLIETTEEFADSPAAVIRRCLDHIGADPEREIDGAEGHTNNAAAKPIQHPLIAKLRSNGIVGFSQMERFYHRCPSWLWNIGKRVLTREGEVQPEWDPVLRTEVIERIRPDSEKLLASIGKPLDYWSF